MKEMLYEVRYLKSSEDMILTLTGFQIPHFIQHFFHKVCFVSFDVWFLVKRLLDLFIINLYSVFDFFINYEKRPCSVNAIKVSKFSNFPVV